MNINLKVARIKKQLTQKEVAEKADISLRYYSKIENGHSVGKAQALKKIAKSLDITVDEILN